MKYKQHLKKKSLAPVEMDPELNTVYLLQNCDNMCTYIGFTNRIHRRILQHNGVLAGGARYTSRSCNWKPIMCIQGFPTKNLALSYETNAQRRKAKKYIRQVLRDLEPLIDSAKYRRRAVSYLQPLFYSRFTNLYLHVYLFNHRDSDASLQALHFALARILNMNHSVSIIDYKYEFLPTQLQRHPSAGVRLPGTVIKKRRCKRKRRKR
jgi:predicted GIY-YIG superfamily endonuclease